MVLATEHAQGTWKREDGWRCLKVAGPLDFSLVGILADLSGTLAAEGVSIFALSTFDTDYLLVKAPDLPRAIQALQRAGHTVQPPHSPSATG
jgi:hypothetical protein